MAFLIKLTKSDFEILWECLQIAYMFGHQVKGRHDNRVANLIDQRLIEMSKTKSGIVTHTCRQCGVKSEFLAEIVDNHWKVQEYRTIEAAETELLVDEKELVMIRSHVDAVVPQPRRRAAYMKLNDALDHPETMSPEAFHLRQVRAGSNGSGKTVELRDT